MQCSEFFFRCYVWLGYIIIFDHEKCHTNTSFEMLYINLYFKYLHLFENIYFLNIS